MAKRDSTSCRGSGGVVAIVGGDGRRYRRIEHASKIRTYRSPRDGGRGELRRLEAALRRGRIGKVVILTRWNSHSATRRVRLLCKRLGITVEVWT